MKKLIFTIILLFISNITYWDFFSDIIFKDDLEYSKLDNISIKQVYFKNYIYNKKFTDSKIFIDKLKEEVKKRYLNQKISYYTFCDIITDLDYVVYYLNNYFDNLKKFENTSNKIYYEISEDNLSNIQIFWEKLRYTLNKKHYQN
jgi:hypothetical protein